MSNMIGMTGAFGAGATFGQGFGQNAGVPPMLLPWTTLPSVILSLIVADNTTKPITTALLLQQSLSLFVNTWVAGFQLQYNFPGIGWF
jgi:hypothetical protein